MTMMTDLERLIELQAIHDLKGRRDHASGAWTMEDNLFWSRNGEQQWRTAP